MPGPDRIDVHFHTVPPAFRTAVETAATLKVPVRVPPWSPELSLALMDRQGIQTVIGSVSVPGVHFGDDKEARALARRCNDYSAELIARRPDRFGAFAALPLPDVEGAIEEAAYALDVLKLDGIGLMTNYGDVWPGNPAFAPVFDELNRRKAILYFHPTAPTCCTHLLPNVTTALIEFPTDSTRCITDLLFSGTLSRCPDIRFIFSHGGGTLPMLAVRIAGGLLRPHMKEIAARIPKGAMYEFKKLYYDVASVTNPISMGALLALAPLTQIFFGSDYPFIDIDTFSKQLQTLGLSPGQLAAIERENAAKLFPRYA